MDSALGCLLGVAVGDAAGAPIEIFETSDPAGRRRVAATEAQRVLRMPGKRGRFRKGDLGKGMVTDDTELAICLARGLAGHSPAAAFPLGSVAAWYSFWYHEGGGFCGGRTCKKAFAIKPPKGAAGGSDSLAAKMQACAAKHNMASKANGQLMRIAPLAVWAHRQGPEEIAAHCAADASLSHPNPACAESSAAYCIAIAHLIRHEGVAEGALAAACAWAQQHAGQEVRQWLLADSLQHIQAIDSLEHLGFARHAFVMAFSALRRRTPFVEAIAQALQCGGDTDTNAAIVGGMVGALWGAAAIPAWMSQPVLEYMGLPEQGGDNQVPRLAELRAGALPDLARALLDAGAAVERASETPKQVGTDPVAAEERAAGAVVQ